jgi:hypothetical protein
METHAQTAEQGRIIADPEARQRHHDRSAARSAGENLGMLSATNDFRPAGGRDATVPIMDTDSQ